MSFLSPKNTARLQKDKKHRTAFLKQEVERNVLKNVSKDQTLPLMLRKTASVLLYKKGKSGSLTLIKNRCILTGRSRSVFKPYNMSRIVIRHLALTGSLPRIKKQSW